MKKIRYTKMRKRNLLWNKTVPPGEAYHIARCTMRGKIPCTLHTHDFAEVFWVEKGEGIHEINGHCLPLKPGMLAAIRPKDRHGFRGSGEEYTIVNVAFPVETLDFLRTRYYPGGKNFLWTATALPFQSAVSASQRRWLRDWAGHLGGAPRVRLEVERFLLELLHELVPTGPLGNVNRSLPDWLAHALEKICEPHHFSLGTPQFAKLAGRTPQHVNAVLKAVRGVTATEVVNQARLDYAAAQLRMSDKKIIEICMDSGLQNPGHFHRLFREHFGTTPRLYRQRLQAVVR
jgi:AraC-like DNA-binding protein/mannose-6-phosphate isomerase-like protein (cupin superfamily)